MDAITLIKCTNQVFSFYLQTLDVTNKKPILIAKFTKGVSD